MTYYIGVDVGTGSVRSAVVDGKGRIVAIATEEIRIWNPCPEYYEQSSANIWSAVVSTVKEVIDASKVGKADICGIGFDATCSLVALDDQFRPLCISPSGDGEVDIIMWLDHRASLQAKQINATRHSVLQSVGGVMSLEMQPPKLAWLKQNMPEVWQKAANLFDLPDFLTWKATGSLTRSLCSLVCKWSYQAAADSQPGWNSQFMALAGLDCLLEDGCHRIGNEVNPPGELCGNGLSAEAAAELGLKEGIPVGASIIDAYAGGLGCLGCSPRGFSGKLPVMSERLVIICGTSSCHITVSEDAIFVHGVWGPYYSVMVPGMWSNEGGQSATGKLIDFVIETHAAYPSARKEAEERGCHLHTYLNSFLADLAQQRQIPGCELTKDYHLLPDFHGNRSPLADPAMRGMVCGLTLSAGITDLAVLYLATLQALSYGTRHIIEEMQSQGHRFAMAYVCGGLRKNPLFIQVTADVIGMPVILPDTEESVLLGAAILGACASENFSSLQEAVQHMGGSGQAVHPDQTSQSFHAKKYEVFKLMLLHQQQYRSVMSA